MRQRGITARTEADSLVSKSMSDRLVYTVPEAGRLLGLGRNAAYEAAKRGDIPTIRMGRLLRVPKGPFHKLVGTEASPQADDVNLGERSFLSGNPINET
jgi:excisionase family DNA binding protein